MIFPFNSKSGLIVIPTRLLGPNGDVVIRLALDTGATESMVNWNIIVLLGYDPAAVSERIRLTTGSGVEFVPQINISEAQALHMIRKNFPILCHTLPPSATVDGVLGLDFFRDHRLELDFRKGQLIVS